MRLEDYLAKKGIKAADFAEDIGVSYTSIYRYLRRQRRPEAAVMRRIKESTEGAVTADDFFDAEAA